MLSADYALYFVRRVIVSFQEMRCAEEFKSFLKEAKNVLAFKDKVDGSRQSKILRRFNELVIGDSLPVQDERELPSLLPALPPTYTSQNEPS